MAIFNQVVSGGGITPSGKYQLLQRVTDDSNNEIGTVCGFHTDANNVEYAVVCLDAQYRLASGNYLSHNVLITNLGNKNTAALLWLDTDTATSNCDKIIDFIGDGSTYTSSAVSHCRAQSFVIDGTTYYGQLPTATELVSIFELLPEINNADTSASQYPELIIPTAGNAWSSSQYNNQNGWHIAAGLNTITKTQLKFIIPVLELPNA